MNKPKRPRDPNQLAKSIVDLAIGDSNESASPAASVMTIQDIARMGGLKGGKARAKSLTQKRRTDIARKAAKARWGKIKRG